MIKLTAIVLLSLAGVAVAAAGPDHGPGPSWSGGGFGHDPAPPQMSAPEIDPSSAISALTLLMGGVTILRSRVKK